MYGDGNRNTVSLFKSYYIFKQLEWLLWDHTFFRSVCETIIYITLKTLIASKHVLPDTNIGKSSKISIMILSPLQLF
jgi:hypothetical protein